LALGDTTMSERIIKINSLIQRNISEIISRDLSLKSGVFVTVSKVDTTPDLRYTRIFVSIFPEKDIPYAAKTLEKELYRLQGALNKKLSMKPLPKIEFKIDMTESKADEIEKIFKEINN
jgi:ribosome-binding factor A